MKKDIITAVQNALNYKKEMLGGLSTNDVRNMFEAFVSSWPKSTDTIDEMDMENILWEAKQHFMRKYRI